MVTYQSEIIIGELFNCLGFKNVILHRIEERLWKTYNIFGLKAGHSTALSVYELTELIECFKRRSTPVY